MIPFRDWLILNEVFDYTSNYREVNKSVYIENWIKFINKSNPETLKQPGIDLERTVFDNHGPRVHYYIYKNFLIFYGKFKSSNQYEVHFWDIKNLEHDIIGSNSFNSVFSAIMSILKDKHFDAGKLDRIYIKNEYDKKLKFYKTIIDKILNKYNVDWRCTIKGDNVVIHPEKELKESTKLLKPTIYNKEKEMKSFREYLAESKVEKVIDLNESIKHTKPTAEKQWDEFQLGKLVIKVPDDSEFDITVSIGKTEIDVSFDDMSDLCKKILKLI